MSLTKREDKLTRQPRRWWTIVGFTALLVVAVWVGLGLIRAWRAARALQADLTAAEALIGDGLQALDASDAIELLHTTRSDLLAVQSAARPFLWLAPYLGWVPGYGPEMRAAPALLDMAPQR
jgi:hypothetical protein